MELGSKNSDIKRDGYILLQNALTNEQLESGLACMKHDNKVDYSIMKQFIDTTFFPAIQRNAGDVITQPKYVKFRFSNNNNSTDASTFHGDIYNHTKTQFLPIYTCLCYFDDAQLEVIPGSHHYNNNGISLQSFNKRKALDVKRGDILVFHSNMHHRGINYNKKGDRRLLQVFEVFPDQKTYNECAPNLIIVESSNSPLVKNIVGPLLYQVSKIPTLIDYITFIHYIMMYNDMHYKMGMMDLPPWEKTNKYITYESGRRAILNELLESNVLEDLNVNILCDNAVYSRSYSNFYLYGYIVYWILSIILLYILSKLWKGEYSIKKLKAYFSKRTLKRR